MKHSLLAVSTVALFCAGIGGAFAQGTPAATPSSTVSAGILCSEITAMSSPEQTAFLRGYQAGRTEAKIDPGMAGAGAMAGDGAASPAGAAAGNAAAGGAAPAGAAGAAAGAPAGGAVAGAGAMASGAGGASDFASIVSECATTPDRAISGMMSDHEGN